MQDLDYDTSFACCGGMFIVADGMQIGPFTRLTHLLAPWPADPDSPLVHGCAFKDRVAIINANIRKLGLRFTAVPGSKSAGLSTVEHADFKAKLASASLSFVGELCGEASYKDLVVAGVREPMRKFMFSVFTTAPAAQLVPPSCFDVVELLARGERLTLTQLVDLGTFSPVLADALAAHAPTLSPQFCSLLTLLLDVARRTFAAPGGGTALAGISAGAAGAGGSDESAVEAEEAAAPGARPPGGGGLEDVLRTGEFFGTRHQPVRQMRRYAQDLAGKSAPDTEACVKHPYDAKKLSPGECAAASSRPATLACV